MTDELKELLRAAKDVQMTPGQLEQQRESFAYGNTHFENDNVTRDTVREASERLKKDGITPN